MSLDKLHNRRECLKHFRKIHETNSLIPNLLASFSTFSLSDAKLFSHGTISGLEYIKMCSKPHYGSLIQSSSDHIVGFWGMAGGRKGKGWNGREKEWEDESKKRKSRDGKGGESKGWELGKWNWSHVFFYPNPGRSILFMPCCCSL